MAVQFDITSRLRRSVVFIDNGFIREGRRTEFLAPRRLVSFVERTDTVIHVTRRSDTLDHLSTAFYGTPFLWWVIADFQPLSDIPILNPIEPLEQGRKLYIPSEGFVRNKLGEA